MKNYSEKIENACNRMVGKGKLPGLIYLSKKTLMELASEFKPRSNRNPEIKKSEAAYTCYFVTDNSLPPGKFKIGPMDEKYFEHEKQLKLKELTR